MSKTFQLIQSFYMTPFSHCHQASDQALVQVESSLPLDTRYILATSRPLRVNQSTISIALACRLRLLSALETLAKRISKCRGSSKHYFHILAMRDNIWLGITESALSKVPLPFPAPKSPRNPSCNPGLGQERLMNRRAWGRKHLDPSRTPCIYLKRRIGSLRGTLGDALAGEVVVFAAQERWIVISRQGKGILP